MRSICGRFWGVAVLLIHYVTDPCHGSAGSGPSKRRYGQHAYVKQRFRRQSGLQCTPGRRMHGTLVTGSDSKRQLNQTAGSIIERSTLVVAEARQCRERLPNLRVPLAEFVYPLG